MHALDAIARVSEGAIADAIRFLAQQHGVRVEGAGAVGIAALQQGAYGGELRAPLVVVVSGGNIDREKFESLTA